MEFQSFVGSVHDRTAGRKITDRKGHREESLLLEVEEAGGALEVNKCNPTFDMLQYFPLPSVCFLSPLFLSVQGFYS